MASIDEVTAALGTSLTLNDLDIATLDELILDDMCKNWIKTIDLSTELLVSDYSIGKSFVKVADVVIDDDITAKGKKARNTVIKFAPNNQKQWQKQVEYVYLIVVNNRIVKIGGTRKGLKGRASSYLCGHHVQERQKSGRCSVTNAYVYNTLHFYLKNGFLIEIYAYEIEPVIVDVDIFGQIKRVSAQVYQAFEAYCLEEYKKQTGKYPVLSDNADPTYKD
jgi:hypothetical protein